MSVFKYLSLFILMLFLVSSTSFAESEFEKWKKRETAQFREFKDKRDKAFSEMLKKQWREFKLFKGEKIYEKPKPVKLPTAKKKLPQEVKPIKGKIIKKMPEISPKPEPLVKAKPKPEPAAKRKGRKVVVNFNGKPVEIYYDPGMKVKAAPKVNARSIGSFWETLSLSDYDDLISQTEHYHQKMNLNDWGYHLLIYRLGEAIYGKGHSSEVNMFTWFVLIKSGYDARAAYNDDDVFLLLPSRTKIFGFPYLKLKDRPFYAIAFDGKAKRMGSLFTYKGDYPGLAKIMDYNIKRSPDIVRAIAKRRLRFSYRDRDYEMPVEYNRNLVNFYEFYPQTDFEVYFNASISPEAGRSLVRALRPLVKDKSEGEAVNMILRFVQTAFKYKTDAGQFGREKYLFPDETLFYPYSDCEDRSILFSYLVQNLTGLEVVALHYPNHLATAVKFSDKITGDYVIHKGERYIVCDPTYINADIGRAMPKFKKVKPRIIPIRKRI